MTPLVPLMQTCRGKRWIALLPPGDAPRVEIYVGATACGELPARADLLDGRVSYPALPDRFAWGALCPRGMLLAVSILDDAFANDPGRAIRLAPFMLADVVGRYAPTSPWVLPYSRLALMIARWEDDLQEYCP